MPIVKVEMWGYECLRCGHTWIPRGAWALGSVEPGKPPPKPKKDAPGLCPHCKSPYWDREEPKK